MSMCVKDALKDEAIPLCIANGEEDIFLDLETVEERLGETPMSEGLRQAVDSACSKGGILPAPLLTTTH